MYLSKLNLFKLNIENYNDKYLIHQKITKIFEKEKRLLYQINGQIITILSDDKPNCNIEDVKKIDINYKNDETLGFTLRLNVADFKYENGIKISKNRHPVENKNVNSFVIKKLKNKGFDILNMNIINEGYIEGKKHSIKVVFVFGYLKVKDSLLFNETIKNGIGNEKYAGCGLLNIFY